MSVPSCMAQVCFDPYQIAWRRFSNFNSPVRSAKNLFIKSSSYTDPDSNPRESWKTNPGLFGKISWSWMSCSPLWIWWLECPCCHSTYNSPLVTHAQFYQAANYRHQQSVTLHHEVLDFFAIGIINLRKLRSFANALQERCFTSIRSANDKDSETTDAIELLLNFLRIRINCLFEVLCHHIITHNQDNNLVITYSFSWMAELGKTCG